MKGLHEMTEVLETETLQQDVTRRFGKRVKIVRRQIEEKSIRVWKDRVVAERERGKGGGG